MKDLYEWDFVECCFVGVVTIFVMLLLLFVAVLIVGRVARLVASVKNRRISDYDIIDMHGGRHKGFFSNPSVFHSSTGKVFVKVGPADNDWERVE